MNLLFPAQQRRQLGGAVLRASTAVPGSRGPCGAAGGPNTQPCLEPPGWDHSPTVFELLPTSRPPGIGPGMPASRERRQLGCQPAHGARAVSREAGQAGQRPPPPNGALARPLGQGRAAHCHGYKGALRVPAPSRAQGHDLTGWGPRRPCPHLFSSAFAIVEAARGAGEFSSQIIIKTATTTADI